MTTNAHISQKVWVLRQTTYYKQYVTDKFELTNQISKAKLFHTIDSAKVSIEIAPLQFGTLEIVPVEIRLADQTD